MALRAVLVRIPARSAQISYCSVTSVFSLLLCVKSLTFLRLFNHPDRLIHHPTPKQLKIDIPATNHKPNALPRHRLPFL